MKKTTLKKWVNGAATLLTILGMIGPFSFQGVQIASAGAGNTIYGTVETSAHAAVTSGTVCAYPTANFTAYENQCDGLDGAGAFLFTVNNVGATYTYNVYVTDANDVAPAAATFVFDGNNQDLGAIHLVAPSVRGIVKNPDGSLSSLANVMIHDATFSSNNSTVMTDANGVFKGGALAAGTYYIDVTPPFTSSGVLSTRNLAVTVTGSTNTYYVSNPIQLVAAKKTITGTVTKPDGTKITDATVNAFSIDGMSGMSNADTDVNGQYSIVIGQGKFQVMVNPKMGGGPPTWGYFDAPKTVSFILDNSIVESQTVNFQVTKFDSTITGKLVYPNGTPVISGAASISAMIAGGYGSCINSGPDSDGNFSLL
ncbi:MAG: carboxypeptidase-like regulatory domain-containing protein [Planctomycetota bacterium]